MELEFTKGGRGKVAPYTTTHVRIPEEIKPFIDLLIHEYKLAIANNTEQEFLSNLKLVNINRIVELANHVIKLKKTKKASRQAIDNLLTAIIELTDINPPHVEIGDKKRNDGGLGESIPPVI